VTDYPAHLYPAFDHKISSKLEALTVTELQDSARQLELILEPLTRTQLRSDKWRYVAKQLEGIKIRIDYLVTR
jgi:HPt (histidine-containing phosphotransfer) domain-containing protein